MQINFLKRVMCVAVCVAVLGVSNLVIAQESGQYKIGVVNLKTVFDNYDNQKASYDQLKKDRDAAQVPIDELSAQIEADRKIYEDTASDMSDEDRRALEEKIETAYGKYKAEFQRLQEDIDRKEKKILEALFEEIQQAVEDVGAQNNYHLVFEGGKSTRSGLLYYSTTLNMTQKVIDHLNSK